MKFIALTAAVSATNLMTSDEYAFMKYVTDFGRSYATKAEFNFRLNIFRRNLAEIEAHNSNPNKTSTMGLNFLADRTDDEKKKMMGLLPNTERKTMSFFNEDNLADSVDWRTKGAVTPVKNQGQCGSCWSFSATGAMEGAHWVATGNLVSLSEQNLVNCSWKQGNLGCNGGLMQRAFTYAQSNPLETEADYPYTATSSILGCKYDKSKGVVAVTSQANVPAGSVSQLMAAISQAPVSVSVDAGSSVFQLYKSGVVTGSACGTQLNHGVLAVGYGTDANGVDYYIVKNSWGAAWGDQGYILLGREDGDGVCGIQMDSSQPKTN